MKRYFCFLFFICLYVGNAEAVSHNDLLHLMKINKALPVTRQNKMGGKQRSSEMVLGYYNSSWDTLLRVSYQYTNTGKIQREVEANYASPNFQSYSRTFYTYNDSDRLIEDFEQVFVSGNWENKTRYLFNYNKEGYNTMFLTQDWKNNQWVSTRGVKDSFGYDTSGTLIYDLEMDLDSNGVWVNTSKIEGSLDSMGNYQTLYLYNWNGGAWVPKVRLTSLKFPAGSVNYYNPEKYTEQVYSNGNWENYWLYEAAYDSIGNLVSELNKTWQKTYWREYTRITNTYDSLESNTFHLDEHWDTLKPTWAITDGTQNFYVYDNDGDPVSNTGNIYNTFSNAWDSNSRVLYFYDPITEVHQRVLSQSHEMYPNPTTGLLFINNKSQLIKSVVVMNLNGTVLRFSNEKQEKTDQILLNLSQLTDGAYLIAMQIGNRWESATVIKAADSK